MKKIKFILILYMFTICVLITACDGNTETKILTTEPPTEILMSVESIKEETIVENSVSKTELEIDNQFITIAGEKYSTDLTEFKVKHMNLTDEDIKTLSKMTALTELNIGYNEITDISPLASLTNLRKLNLESNEITDINPLRNLTQLTELILHFNDITDISPLADMSELTKLYLHGNGCE